MYRNMIQHMSTDIRFPFGRASIPGGALRARSFRSALDSTFGRSLDLAGVGPRGAVTGASAEGYSLGAGAICSTATRFTIATPISMVISGAMRRSLAATAACAGLPRGKGAPLPAAREPAGASLRLLDLEVAPPRPQVSEAPPLRLCDPAVAPSLRPYEVAATVPLAALAAGVSLEAFLRAAVPALEEACGAVVSMAEASMVAACGAVAAADHLLQR